MISLIKQRFLQATVIGNALEYYDVTLYGFFAALLAPKFFPTLDSKSAILASLSTFAAGFLMRPLGGAVFGHIGDRYGRKKALLLSIFIITIPTLVIGLLPTYDQIGIIAPILLIICRLLQGFCAGGEYCGAAVFIAENAKQGSDGFASSLLSVSGFLGATIGTTVGAICTKEFMPDWGWRIPFIMGAIFGLIGFYIRQSIKESPTFSKIEAKEEIVKIPLIKTFKEDRINLLCTFGIGAAATIPYYIISIYTNIVLTQYLNLSTSYLMCVNTLLMIWWILLLPLMGLLVDKIGKKQLMSLSSLGIIIMAYPISVYTYDNLSLKTILIMQFALSIIASGLVAPISAFIPTLFAPNRRYSGIGISYNSGTAFLGGTTPLVAAALVNYTEMPTAPAFYMMLSGLIGWLAVYFAKEVFNPQELPSVNSPSTLLSKQNINNN